ncbi:MAG: [protein-PII] uridylyltransferase [Acidimicrobiaceae bacterium]|jgi:[protein-PII] uridylyltransferase|nr:[protein-PII] uridylyltransferase [Acidimicrobiaceae bacterium]
MGDAKLTGPDSRLTAGHAPLRAGRDALCEAVLAGRLPAAELPPRYAALADTWLSELFAGATKGKERGYALVAVGGYGRGHLCPGSDLDLLLLHRGRSNYDRVAQAIWYAIWDDGTRLDHSVRTRGEALAVARSDLKAVLGLLDARLIAGDERLCERVLADVRELWRKQSSSFVPELERAATARHREAGELAFLLEPDLKQSAGGLRDMAALRSLALALPSLAPLVATDALAEAERVVVAARVVLHCRTGRDSDRLLLQEQDQVAEVLKLADADVLMAGIADAGRTVTAAWVDTWRRARALLSKGGAAMPELALGPGIVLRSGEVALAEGADPAKDPSLLVRLGVAAAQRTALIERESLDRLELDAPPPPEPWSQGLRDAFVALLGTGDALVPVIEALDQRRLFERLIPEWKAVRNRPQRNAYHRFTVDRHLLEAVARAGEHVRDVDRPDLLLMGALLHDLGKGFDGDHSEVGEDLAVTIARRMGFAEPDVAVLARLVAYHLVIPEFATRRDLDDPSTARLVAKIVEDRRTLALLTALTEADSRATGASAWSPWKAELVARLAERVARVLDGLPLGEPAPFVATPEQAELLAGGKLALRATGKRVTIVAPDRVGLLAAAAGALALHRCNVRRATAAAYGPGMAVEVFDVEPLFDRVPDWASVERDVAAILEGTLDLSDRLAEHDRTYARSRRPVSALPPQQHVIVDNDTSDRASIIEVRAPDRLGLLYEITAALTGSGCDVEAALVDTLGHEVVDTFYVRDAEGHKLSSGAAIQTVCDALNLVIATESDDDSSIEDST